MGRSDLPLEVGTWLRPVHAALNKSITSRKPQAAEAGWG